jgi:hypothetical protein
MKGYFQRLMNTVIAPAESVHPWTGSVFAAAHEGGSNVIQTEEVAPEAAAGQSRRTTPSSSTQFSPASARTQTSPLATQRESLIAESQATQIAPGSTVEQSRGRVSAVNERINFKPLITNTERTSDSADATEAEITPAQVSETALAPRGRRSLAVDETPIKPGNTRQVEIGSSRPSTEPRAARASRNSVTADWRADEIQIHIGRIEVTAIHPPTPPARKARDKEISLDAYLKRRDGRTG